MQLESKDFYRLTAEQTGISGELIKSIGDAVFRSLSELQRDAPDLILQVDDLGRRFARKSKLTQKLESLNYERDDRNRITRPVEEIDADQVILDRLAERYVLFLDKKQQHKLIRDAYSSTSPSTLPPGELSETSSTEPGERQGVPSGELSVDQEQDGLPKTGPSLGGTSLLET